MLSVFFAKFPNSLCFSRHGPPPPPPKKKKKKKKIVLYSYTNFIKVGTLTDTGVWGLFQLVRIRDNSLLMNFSADIFSLKLKDIKRDAKSESD